MPKTVTDGKMEVVLGFGDVAILDVANEEEGWAGISFVNPHKQLEVGEAKAMANVPDTDLDIFLRVRTDNVKSLDVVIERLCAARTRLIELQA